MGSDYTAFAALQVPGSLQIPFVVSVKNLTVLTTGSPADIGTITIPSWVTRFITVLTGFALKVVCETAAGTLAAANFTVRDTAAGAGLALSAACGGPTAAGVVTSANGTVLLSTVTTLYIHQNADAANAGTISVYLSIAPLL